MLKPFCQDPLSLWLQSLTSFWLASFTGIPAPSGGPSFSRLTSQFQILDQFESIRNPVVHVLGVQAESPLGRADLRLIVGSRAVSPAPGSWGLPSLHSPWSSFLCRSLSWREPPMRLVQEDSAPFSPDTHLCSWSVNSTAPISRSPSNTGRRAAAW